MYSGHAQACGFTQQSVCDLVLPPARGMATSQSIGPASPTKSGKEHLSPSGRTTDDQFQGQTAELPPIEIDLESTTDDENFKLGGRSSVVTTRTQLRSVSGSTHKGMKLFIATVAVAALAFVVLKCRQELQRGLNGGSQKTASTGIFKRRLMEQRDVAPALAACVAAEDESIVTSVLENIMALARSEDVWPPIAAGSLSTEGMSRQHRIVRWGEAQMAALEDPQLAAKASLTVASKDAIALYDAGSALFGYLRTMADLPDWYYSKVQPKLTAIVGTLGGWQYRSSLDIDNTAPASWKVVRAGALLDLNECIRAMRLLAALGDSSLHLPRMPPGLGDMALNELKRHAAVLEYRLDEKKKALEVQKRQLDEADESLIRTYLGHIPEPGLTAVSLLSHVWKASLTDLIVDAGTTIHLVYFLHELPDCAAQLASACLGVAAAYEGASYLKDTVTFSPEEMATMLRKHLQFMTENWGIAVTDRTLTVQRLADFVKPPGIPPKPTGTPAPYYFIGALETIQKLRRELLAVSTQDHRERVTPDVVYLILEAHHAAQVSSGLSLDYSMRRDRVSSES